MISSLLYCSVGACAVHGVTLPHVVLPKEIHGHSCCSDLYGHECSRSHVGDMVFMGFTCRSNAMVGDLDSYQPEFKLLPAVCALIKVHAPPVV
jgi:hypothetical protein